MGYEIWDRYERALIDDFDTEDQALDYLRGRIRTLTAESAARWLDRLQLECVTDEGRTTKVVCAGVDLFRLIYSPSATPA